MILRWNSCFIHCYRALNSFFQMTSLQNSCFIHCNETAFNSFFPNDMKTKFLLHSLLHSMLQSKISMWTIITSIGYRGNWKAYTTPTRTLFDRFILFVYENLGYPSDIYLASGHISSMRYLQSTKMAFYIAVCPCFTFFKK